MHAHSTARSNQQTTTKVRPKAHEEKVSVIGLGYVGLPVALIAAEAGYQVAGFDTNQTKISELKERRADALNPDEQELLHTYQIDFDHLTMVLSDSDVFIICVPTPVSDDHLPDLGPLIAASKTVGAYLKKGAMVLVESTVNPGVSEEVVIPILERVSGLRAGKDFDYAYCPERINPGDSTFNTHNIPRVLGAITDESLDRAINFYNNIINAPIKPMENIKEAEAVKMIENAFRDINIAFVNELAMAFEREGIDILNVIEGAATKPFAFMAHYPGCGVGGHCIPVDPYYLIQYGKRHGFTHHFLMIARKINNHMPMHTVSLLKRALEAKGKTLSGTRVALLGLTYKKNIGDIRESPATVIRDELLAAGADVASYDPYALDSSTAATLEEALQESTAAIIATDHDMFTGLLPEDFTAHGTNIVIDGRNCLSKELYRASSISYHGIGRP